MIQSRDKFQLAFVLGKYQVFKILLYSPAETLIFPQLLAKLWNQVTFSSLSRWKILTREKIKTGWVLSGASLKGRGAIPPGPPVIRSYWRPWCHSYIVVYYWQIWTLLHHNTQPVLILNRENLQNFKSKKGPRR